MTVPANLTARHYAEQAVLAAVIAERQALADFKAAPINRDQAELRAWRRAHDAVNDAADVYFAAVQTVNRVADPAVENIAEPGTFETPADADDEPEVPDLLAALQRSIDRHRARQTEPDIDPADRYDSGYVASPAVADGRAADEFYGRDT